MRWQGRPQARVLGADGNRDQARMAHQLQLGTAQHLHEILVRHRGIGIVGAVLLDDLREDALRTPVGLARVEDFRVVGAVVIHVVAGHADAVAALGTARVHGELALRLVDGRRDAVHGERRDETDQEKNEHGDPALGDHAQHAAQGDRAHERIGVLPRRLPAVGAAVVVRRMAATTVVHRHLRRSVVDGRFLGRAVVERLLPIC